jgi:hypothetical protein
MLLILAATAVHVETPLLAQAPARMARAAKPVRAPLSIVELRARDGSQYTIARLNDVMIYYCTPNSANERPVDEALEEPDDAQDHEIFRQPPRIEFQGGIFDEFGFGSGPGLKTMESAAEPLGVVLKKEIERLHAAAPLAVEQRKKLELAGYGDINRVVHRMHRLKSNLEHTETVLTSSLFRDWVVPLVQEAQALGRLLDQGPFGDGSLFAKTLNTIEPRGSQVPDIPQDGWINGAVPDYKGKPYLIHFWGTFVAAHGQLDSALLAKFHELRAQADRQIAPK